ncbi:MAG: UvrD-helicase domain-containing protein, partial [Myxococcota bacterium]|nr:UvrD-helicase domain-containing protein [Myxococcota bacterium]
MSDDRARHLARTVFDRPIAVEAGAGTGKTTTLVARVLTWCVGPGWEQAAARSDEEVAARVLQGVVAITFTEAAAAEMAERVAEAMEAVASGLSVHGIPEAGLLGDRDEERRRARALASQVDRMWISTIHAFCRRVLSASPFEAGLHPAFEIDASGEETEALVREVGEEHFVRACDPQSELRDAVLLLGELGIGPGDLVAALHRLVDSSIPASELLRDPFST